MYVYTPCDVHALSLIKHIGPGVRSAKYGAQPVSATNCKMDGKNGCKASATSD